MKCTRPDLAKTPPDYDVVRRGPGWINFRRSDWSPYPPAPVVPPSHHADDEPAQQDETQDGSSDSSDKAEAASSTAEPDRTTETEGVTSTGPGLVVRSADEIDTRPVNWFWHHKLVGGAINMVIGMPDTGKSVMTMDIAARTTTGRDWPLGENTGNSAGTVAILAVEDSPATTIVPRLKAAGADLSKVKIIEGVQRFDGARGEMPTSSFDVGADVDKLEELRKRFPDLSLVIIDPLDSYIGKVDTRSGNEVRDALWPLTKWTEDTGVTVLIVHHFNKNPSANALDRVSGSRSFGALPRSIWVVQRESEDRDGRILMSPAKLNLALNPEGMAYELVPSETDPEIPRVEWSLEPVSACANALIDNQPTKSDEAVKWLRRVLADGDVRASQLKEMARDAGHSWSTVEKVKSRAGVQSRQEYDSEANRVAHWKWGLAT